MNIHNVLRRGSIVVLFLPALVFAQLRLVSPNGGESIKVGSRVTIQWTGIPATDTVTLEYSTDAGTQWMLITNTATNLQYTWLNVPNTVSANCLVRVTHTVASTPSKVVLIGNGYYQSADFSRDGKYVLGASADGNAYIWDAQTGQIVHTWQTESGANIKPNVSLNFWGEFSPSGTTFATVSPTSDSNPSGNMIRVFDAASGAKLHEWNLRSEPGGGYTSGICRFSPDGTRLAVTGKDSVYVFNIATGAVIAKLGGFAIYEPPTIGSNVPSFCDWNPAGTEIIVCAAFKNTTFPTYVRNDASTGDTLQTYWLTTNVPFFTLHGAVHFAPDGKRFLAVTQDTTVRVWDVASGKILLQIKSNLREIIDAAFSHDGKSIVTVGFDSLGASGFSIKQWDASTGALMRDVGNVGVATRTIEFSNDDSRILLSANSACYVFQAGASGGAESDLSDAPFSIIPNPGGTVVISTTNVVGHTNDIVNIPLFINDPGGAIAAGATHVSLTLAYNVTMLEPLGATPAGLIANGLRAIALTLPINPFDTLLTILQMRVALGNDSVTKLDVIGPATDAPTVSAVDSDGSFQLLDLCTQGGARLVNPNGVASIAVLAPNPAKDQIVVAVDLIEDGQTSLILSDESGRRVKTIFRENATHGRRIEQVSLENVSAGTYFLTLQTPTFRTTAPLEVAR